MYGMFNNSGKNATTWENIGTLKIYANKISGLFQSCPGAKATINIYAKPSESYGVFTDSATNNDSQIVVNYTSEVTNINDIVNTKSTDSHVTKGELLQS
jgi:hypothetical protein